MTDYLHPSLADLEAAWRNALDALNAAAAPGAAMTAPVWSDTPPTEPGWYWAQHGTWPAEIVYVSEEDGVFVCGIGTETNPNLYKWGPRIPDAETLAAFDQPKSTTK